MYDDGILRDKFVGATDELGHLPGWGWPEGESLTGVGQDSSPIPVPLTDRQFEDYAALMAEAESLRHAGLYEDAERVARVASNILRTSAPCLD